MQIKLNRKKYLHRILTKLNFIVQFRNKASSSMQANRSIFIPLHCRGLQSASFLS